MGEVTLQADQVGEVMLGGQVLPGTYQSMRIRRGVRLDEARVRGRSGTSKRPMGYEDVEADLVLACASDGEKTAEEKASVIIGLFQSQDSLARPFVYDITHKLLNQAWGVRQVVFKDCDSGDDNTSDIVWLTLRFVEYKPLPALRAEARKTPATATDPVLGPALSEVDSERAGPTTPTILTDPDYLARGVPEHEGQTLQYEPVRRRLGDDDLYRPIGGSR